MQRAQTGLRLLLGQSDLLSVSLDHGGREQLRDLRTREHSIYKLLFPDLCYSQLELIEASVVESPA